MNTLHLLITTPRGALVDMPSVTAVRARDATGSFGILPGHTDFITVLADSVLRWQTRESVNNYCAVRGGVLMVQKGTTVRVASKEGLVGDDIESLQALVQEYRAIECDTDREEMTRQMRLHTQAMRQIMSYLTNPPRQFDIPSDLG